MIKQVKNITINFLCILKGKKLRLKQKNIEKLIEVNYMVTVEEIRMKIKKSGWKLSELPMRSGDEIRKWKFIAEKGDKSFTIDGVTILDAMQNMGKLLGVWRP